MPMSAGNLRSVAGMLTESFGAVRSAPSQENDTCHSGLRGQPNGQQGEAVSLDLSKSPRIASSMKLSVQLATPISSPLTLKNPLGKAVCSNARKAICCSSWKVSCLELEPEISEPAPAS